MNKDAVAEMNQQYQVETAEKLVPEGYKQTEVGVTNSSGANLNATSGGPKGGGVDSRRIPEGWRCLPFEDVLTIRHGRDQKTVESINGKYPIFGTGGQMGWAVEYLYDKPSVLIGRKGSINKPRYMEIPFWTVDTLFYSEIKSGFNAKFIFYKFCMINWEQYNEASGVPSLNSRTIEKVTALFPTFKEQCIIANALSDTDALLSELEKLITKKQAIKTATMQQLLTGRTRLPQFANHPDGSKKGYKQSELGEIPEDWEAKNFGDLFEPSITRKKINPSELISFVGMQDVSERAQLVNQSQIQYSTIRSGFTYFEKDDVLVAKITPCFENGKGCHAVNLKTDIGFGSTEFHVLRATNLSDSRFIYFWTTRESFRAELETEMVGSAGHRRVPLSALQNYLIPCPSDKQEQTTIATILSDMDDEIQALEQRLNKTRQIKQGMMQELLMGKTRLIKGKKHD